MEWPTFSGKQSPIEQLVELSHFYGSDPRMVIAGGGNTSVKDDAHLWVKASGYALSNIPAEGFVQLDRAALQKLLESQLPGERDAREEAFKQAIMAARVEGDKAKRPSVEAVLHHLLPGKFVVHSHATLVNAFGCCDQGQELIEKILSDAAIWIGNVDPGFVLAQTIAEALAAYQKKTGRKAPRAIVLQNHGLVVAGDTPEQLKADTDWVLARLGDYLQKQPENPWGTEKGKLDAAQTQAQINLLAPALRGLLADGPALKIVSVDDSPAIMELLNSPQGQSVAASGPLSPDQIVYCKSFPLWFEPQVEQAPEQTVKRLGQAIEKYRQAHQCDPRVILVPSVGMFCAADDWAGADAVRQVYADAVQVMHDAARLGQVRYLSEDFRQFIENWEVESYRRRTSAAAASRGRAAGKVAIITGAAQGFGLEISQGFVAEGGVAILTDMNEAGACQAARQLCDQAGAGRALGLAVNVASTASLEKMIHAVVRAYGGFDVLISNAGVLKAGSVKTLSEKDFDFVTAVNYKGFFLCTQRAAPVLAIQRLAKSDYFSDIIQINSKSGLQGSNKNGAYAGGKFGGIGLVQSFAMELVEDGVKVNAICPGNFFDGPLWSDPKNGLFMQYLNTGKVPGAKTIADVKRFYEAKVPMNRGCATADVMKAIFYLMDQAYETGQALPVTGGQVMLH